MFCAVTTVRLMLGGCGVVITSDKVGRGINFLLENNGIKHTSNCAELRSVISGLGIREWTDEAFESAWNYGKDK